MGAPRLFCFQIFNAVVRRAALFYAGFVSCRCRSLLLSDARVLADDIFAAFLRVNENYLFGRPNVRFGAIPLGEREIRLLSTIFGYNNFMIF